MKAPRTRVTDRRSLKVGDTIRFKRAFDHRIDSILSFPSGMVVLILKELRPHGRYITVRQSRLPDQVTRVFAPKPRVYPKPKWQEWHADPSGRRSRV